jgi:hypothetical protein
MNRAELEKLLEKPRAFRNAMLAPEMPLRKAMFSLCSDNFSFVLDKPRHYEKLLSNRKYRKDEPLF